jgi:tRNA A-37 threonylcarbamoyl transferase component Bud32
LVIEALEAYQFAEFYSDRELSVKAWLSPTMVSKIKKKSTMPKFSTLRKLKLIGVNIPIPTRDLLS